jgi:serine phosphatase RsbU (regulator of sigma subunit)
MAPSTSENWRTDLSEPETFELVKRALIESPTWQIFYPNEVWLCPFCAKGAVRKSSSSYTFALLVTKHLLERCPVWQGEEEVRERPSEELQHQISQASRHTQQLEFVQRGLASQQNWNITLQRTWFCPYCAQRTTIPYPSQKPAPPELVKGILHHLGVSCTAYQNGKGTPKTLQEIKALFQQKATQAKQLQAIRERLQKDELWGVRDKGGNWACPYCRKVIPAINISTAFFLGEVAPPKIFQHLLKTCPAYRAKQSLAPSAEELRKAAGIFAAPPEEAKRETAADWKDEIIKQLSDVRQSIGVSKQLEGELEAAREQQRRMLPKNPQIAGFEFECVYRPSSKVGGDFYDFVNVSDKKLGIVVGDVSGHGIDSALVMGMTKKAIQMHGRECDSPSECLKRANTDLFQELGRNTFATVFYGVLDTGTKKLRFVRAGHNPLLIYNPRREATRKLELYSPKGLAVGMDAGAMFNRILEEKEIQLEHGDILIQYTDGYFEAFNKKRQQFGMERMCQVVREYEGQNVRQLIHLMDAAVRNFMEDSAQADDIILLGVRIAS